MPLFYFIYLFIYFVHRARLIQVQSELNPSKIEFVPFLFTLVFTVVKSQIRMETAQNCSVFFHFD
jgi:hypothetical protein